MIELLFGLIIFSQANIFETEETRDFEIILKDIEELKNNPIDINGADFASLAKIPGLMPADGLKIVEYRKTHGPFRVLDDLLKIPGFDVITYEQIKPFITLKAKAFRFKKFATRLRMETEIPTTENSNSYHTKLQAVFDQYTISLVTEKDPDERPFFDYYAAGLLVDEGVRKFALGKYNLDFGSGVVLSSVGSYFQALDFNVMTHERGIIPYTSVLENGGFFGGAVSDSFFVNYALFYSNQKLDGRIDSFNFATSFDESGDHIDSASLDRKDRINEELFGFSIRHRFANLRLASNSYWTTYEPPFAGADSFTRFYGSRFWISGISLRYSSDYFVVFSEWARSFQNRLGGLFGFSGFFSYVDFNLVGKYFPAGFYSPKGIEAGNDYLGGVLDLSHRSKIARLGMNLAVNNRTEEDTTQYDLRFNFEKKLGFLSARLQMRWRFQEELRDLASSKVFLHITPWENIFCDLRFEQKHIYDRDALARGIFGAAELGLIFGSFQMRIRYGLFDTDSYAARIYAYETDLPGIVNNRMLYGPGHHGFVYFVFEPMGNIKFSIKYSILNKDAETTKQLGCQLDARL